MNKKNIITKIACKTGLRKNIVASVVGTLEELIIDILQKGDCANFAGFGKFYTRQRGERKFVNFQTGEKFITPPKLVPMLKFSKNFVEKF